MYRLVTVPVLYGFVRYRVITVSYGTGIVRKHPAVIRSEIVENRRVEFRAAQDIWLWLKSQPALTRSRVINEALRKAMTCDSPTVSPEVPSSDIKKIYTRLASVEDTLTDLELAAKERMDYMETQIIALDGRVDELGADSMP